MRGIISLYLLFTLLLGCKGHPHSSYQDVSPHQRIDSLIERVREDFDIPGLSLVAVVGDSVVFMESAGVQGRYNAEPIGYTTLFSAQSISKTFTSLACLVATQEGLLALDTPVIHYLPEFRVQSIHDSEAYKHITLRHLLSHTSGLPADAPGGNIFTADHKGAVYVPLDERISSLNEVWLTHEVGSQYSYSNIGFDLAARVLEEVTGELFHQYMKRKVLDPLQMTQSTFHLDSVAMMPSIAKGHCYNTQDPLPVKFSALGAGGLYTCSADMAHFLQAAIQRFPQILDSATYQELVDIPFSNEISGYALGLTVNHLTYCTLQYSHTGNGYGFTTSMAWIPEYKVGVSILCNREAAFNGLIQIQQAALSEVLPVDPQTLSCKDIHQYSSSLEEQDIPYFKSISGNYSNGPVTLSFELQGNQFGVLAPNDGSFQTIHFISRHEWLIEDEAVIRFTFAQGRITNQNNGMTFHKVQDIPKQKGENRPEWKEYIGNYRSYAYGVLASFERIDLVNGHLRLNGNYLYEHLPNLFFDQFGQVVDARGDRLRIEYGEYVKVAE